LDRPFPPSAAPCHSRLHRGQNNPLLAATHGWGSSSLFRPLVARHGRVGGRAAGAACGAASNERNRVPVFHGTARMVDPHKVASPDGAGAVSSTKRTHRRRHGRRPYRPAKTWTSPIHASSTATAVLNMRTTPRSITIYGAGHRGLRICLHLSRSGHQGQLGQCARQSSCRFLRRRDH